MAKTRLELTALMNRMKAATAAAPITPTEFANFMDDWVNYMTKDGAYDAGVLEQWKTETLALQNANLNANIQAAVNAATQAAASAASAVAVAQGAATARPSVRPTVLFDFANSRYLDSKIPFTRVSIGTYFDRNGLMKTATANKPRFTHDPITCKCLGLLMEESRTNYLLQSSDFSNSLWLKNRCNVTISATKGVYSSAAFRINSTGEADPQLYFDTVALAAVSKTVTFSVWLWTDEATSTKATLRIYGKTGIEELTSKIVTVTNVPTRFEITQTFSASAVSTQLVCRIDPWEGETESPVAGRYMYVDAAQCEVGIGATSYIPTTTVAVTRASDLIQISSTLFQELFPTQGEGTVFMSAQKAKPNTSYPYYIMFAGPNTANGRNEIRINNFSAPNDAIGVELYNDNSLQNSGNVGVAQNSYFNIAFAWKKNDAKTFINNIAIADDSSVDVPLNITSFSISHGGNTVIAQICFWPKRLTNTELQTLSATGLFGKSPSQSPTIGDLMSGAFLSPYAILRNQGKSLLKITGTGAQVTDNINLPYDFIFEIVTLAGSTVTSQPSATCTAGTDNLLVVTVPNGKTLWYAITPIFEY